MGPTSACAAPSPEPSGRASLSGAASRGLAALTAGLLLAPAACGPDAPATGVGPLTLGPADVQVVGTSEAIGTVRDLEVLPDGSVWLLDSVEPFFVGFDAQGRLLGSWGSQGGGPEELRRPSGLVAGGIDGQAWVFDWARHAFVRVSQPDGAWAEIPVPRDAIPPGAVRGGMDLLAGGVRTARLGDEVVVPWTTAEVNDGIADYHMAVMQADLAALDPATGAVRPLVTLGEVLEDPSADFTATDGGFPLWYRLWDGCGDHLRVHDRVTNQLRGFDASGEEVEPVQLPPVRLTEVTPREFARAVFPFRQAEVVGAVGQRLTPEDSTRLINEIAGQLTGSPRELAAYLPRYVDFRCGTDGTMWLRPIDLARGGLEGGLAWLRVDPDGTVREVRMPERFDPHRFTGERVWGVQRDAYDVASVAWIALPAGGS